MTVKVNDKDKNIKIKVPNWLVANRFTFGILKCVLKSITGIRQIRKIKYKHIKPFIKHANEYKNYEIVTINTQQGAVVKIYL